jgi:hypothetical protein
LTKPDSKGSKRVQPVVPPETAANLFPPTSPNSKGYLTKREHNMPPENRIKKPRVNREAFSKE